MAKSKQCRKEIFSMRVEPRVLFLLDLISRIQRRNRTNCFENMVEESIRDLFIDHEKTIKASDVIDQIWDIDEDDRILKLSKIAPYLLLHKEQIRLKELNLESE